jgi:hypothetical protein
MTDTIITRIKLPGPIHRDVKAEAVRHNINLDEALGMCVAHLCDIVVPLSWLDPLDRDRERLSGEE